MCISTVILLHSFYRAEIKMVSEKQHLNISSLMSCIYNWDFTANMLSSRIDLTVGRNPGIVLRLLTFLGYCRIIAPDFNIRYFAHVWR